MHDVGVKRYKKRYKTQQAARSGVNLGYVEKRRKKR
jgi:hypothetical protein